MLRVAGFLVLLFSTTSLFAQWEVRSGLRAGYALVTGIDREDLGDTAHGAGFGGEFLVGRGPLAVSASLDYYDAGTWYPGSVSAVGLDALCRFRLRRDRAAWVALGRVTVDPFSDVGSVSVWAPSAGYSWPLGKRQLYVTLRHHDAALRLDPRFRPANLDTTLLMVGFRSTNLLDW